MALIMSLMKTVTLTVRSVDPVTGETTTAEVYTVAADGMITLTSTTIETKIAEGMTTEQKTYC